MGAKTKEKIYSSRAKTKHHTSSLQTHQNFTTHKGKAKQGELHRDLINTVNQIISCPKISKCLISLFSKSKIQIFDSASAKETLNSSHIKMKSLPLNPLYFTYNFSLRKQKGKKKSYVANEWSCQQ